MLRTACYAIAVASLVIGSVHGQEAPSGGANSLFPDNQPAGTLPPVEVRPPTEFAEDIPLGMFPRAGATAGSSGNSISWTSGAIYSDRQLVGPYNQPVWTTQRPWATTRVYVLPPGQAQVEQWVRPTFPRGSKPKFRFLEEFAIGLPGRFQLDLYERWNVEPNDQDRQAANHEGVQLELRWALADWDVIPLNPTLYAEWVEKGGPQEKPNVYELKLLLGDEIVPNLYYATNFVLEQETSGEREQELAWSQALSATVIDRILLAGIESNLTSTTVHGGRSDAEVGLTLGPSLQLRLTNRTFLDVVGLLGVTGDAPDAQMFIIFGYQFGNRAAPSVQGPRATIGN